MQDESSALPEGCLCRRSSQTALLLQAIVLDNISKTRSPHWPTVSAASMREAAGKAEGRGEVVLKSDTAAQTIESSCVKESAGTLR